LRVRGSAQSHHPGGVTAKILGQRGINPDCAARSGRVRRPDEPCGGFKDRRLIRQHGRLGQPTMPNFPDLPLPNEIHALVDPRIKAVVNGATESGGFEELSLRMI